MADPGDFSFERLRRRPDVEAPNLFAVDAADRLLLDTAADALTSAAPGEVVVIGDNYGGLTLGAAALYGVRGMRVHQDPVTAERALAANAAGSGLADAFESFDLVPGLVDGANVVLLRLPRSLDALAEVAQLVAAHASADVTVYAGGMVKHLTRAMNDVLLASFASVRAGLARQKARVLTVEGAAPEGRLGLPGDEAPADPAAPEGRFGRQSEWPRREYHADLGLWVCAHGAAFAGTSIDIGTRFLLTVLAAARPDARTAIDLGCGTGVIAASLARARPGIHVIATDQSAAAVASARETMLANGVADRVDVVRDDALSAQPASSAELIVVNPPFHIGAAVHAGAALKLFDDAARVLEPGGELWAVWNSHLGYRTPLERIVGPTTQVARNAKFTVTRSVRRNESSGR
ncbi:class I SAM-dependent methyltransferase [Diaminobutyricibacter tongyongensis]|uniref:class I SAM-dependent methyltransferase n=1 Tax=Leifsonia tongyongensis TaxID=1268043 RepID=UPI003083EFE6